MVIMGRGSLAGSLHLFVISAVILSKVKGQNLVTENVTLIQGEMATISCKTTNNKDSSTIQLLNPSRQTIFFSHLRALKDSRYQLLYLSDNELWVTLSNVSLSDEGRYVCVVNSNPLVEAYTYITVLVPPGSPVIESRENVVSEGNEMELNCTAKGSKPAASIRWMKGGKEVTCETTLTETYDGLFTVTSQFTFSVTKEDDGVPVDCIIEHPAVEDLLAQRLLEVLYKPEVRIAVTHPEGLTREGDNLDLSCVAKGKPRPHQINWLRGEEDVPSTAVVDGSDLYIKNLTKSYEGTYRCVAINAVGKAYDDYVLHVYGAKAVEGAPRKMNLNIMGGVAAVLMLAIGCALIVGTYLSRSKGFYDMHEAKESDDEAGADLIG